MSVRVLGCGFKSVETKATEKTFGDALGRARTARRRSINFHFAFIRNSLYCGTLFMVMVFNDVPQQHGRK